MLRRKLGELGVARPPIDADRRFVFGYSMGGMMAYKLAHEIGDHFAALWVMAGAIGGRSHEGLTGDDHERPDRPIGRVPLRAPRRVGRRRAAGSAQDTSGRVQSTFVPDLYAVTGMPAAEIPVRKTSLRHLAAAIEISKVHDAGDVRNFFKAHPRVQA